MASSQNIPFMTLDTIPERKEYSREASILVADLQAEGLNFGSKREAVLLKEYRAGNVPKFMRRLCPVPLKQSDGTTLVLYCLPDYLCLGTDDDFVHTPMDQNTAQRVADIYGLVLGTPEMEDAARKSAEVKVDFRPMVPGRGYPYATMMDTSRWPKHTEWFKADFTSNGGRLGQLVSGHKKGVIIHHWLLTVDFRYAGIHGGYFNSDVAFHNFEAERTAHIPEYNDYSHGTRLWWPGTYVVNTAAATDTSTTIAERLMSDNYRPLSSGRFKGEPRFPVTKEL